MYGFVQKEFLGGKDGNIRQAGKQSEPHCIKKVSCGILLNGRIRSHVLAHFLGHLKLHGKCKSSDRPAQNSDFDFPLQKVGLRMNNFLLLCPLTIHTPKSDSIKRCSPNL
jgi:hypothetical protein